MTDPNPARPSDRNVARFRQFKQAREFRIPRCADGDAVASHAWPRYFKVSTTDAVSIADTHLVIRKSLDGEVFSELAESKSSAAQKTLPVMVRIHLVDEYGTLLPAVTGEIGLCITIDVEFAHHSPSINWRFPD